MGQCSSGLQAVVKGNRDYEVKSKAHDPLWLLGTVKKTTFGIDEKINKRLTLLENLLSLVTMRQGASESDDSFLKHFNSRFLTFELAGGSQCYATKTLSMDPLLTNRLI